MFFPQSRQRHRHTLNFKTCFDLIPQLTRNIETSFVQLKTLLTVAFDQCAVCEEMPAKMFAAFVVLRLREANNLLGHWSRFIDLRERDKRLGQPHPRAIDCNRIANGLLKSVTLFECRPCFFVISHVQLCPSKTFQRKRDLAVVSQLTPKFKGLVHPRLCSHRIVALPGKHMCTAG